MLLDMPNDAGESLNVFSTSESSARLSPFFGSEGKMAAAVAEFIMTAFDKQEAGKDVSAVKTKKAGGVFTTFIDAAIKEASISTLSDGTIFGRIPSCPGVWADGETEQKCLETLQEVLEEWMLFKIREGDRDFPVLEGINLNTEWKEDSSWAGEDIESDQPERTN